ncbi:RNA-binding S4 domain-containing protein [Nocardioides marmoribigeumensis]|uniref:Ribosome-associated protein n=1 Tax=Nocardioides marmoribigeumensis TaxID=433649 RepID=A0ABU2BYT7_9ACTN|nr:RNA-binding S4 domain-containing protein [Nocardioides marmoribigeumensis]MDR7363554.1 ribosome-associated protein [Nocardioides marmoribigeumensis]
MRLAGRRRSREPEPRVVSIQDDVIRLGQFLKLAGLVDSGAEAKEVIADGLVEVDGQVDTRRGAQLRAGAVVSLRGERVRVGEPGEEPDVPW